MPILLTAKEVSRRLNVSLSTVYNLTASGALESHRLGAGSVRPRGLRIPETTVSAYLAASRDSGREATTRELPSGRARERNSWRKGAMTYKHGDRVTVTNPIQPTRHQGGETATVTTANGNLVRIQEDNGRQATVHADELSPAT